jgi:hypothetical protein
MKAQRGELLYGSALSLTSALDEGGWSTPRLNRCTPGNDPVPIVQEAGLAPRAGLDGFWKYRPPPGFDPRTFQPIVFRYTDNSNPAHIVQHIPNQNIDWFHICRYLAMYVLRPKYVKQERLLDVTWFSCLQPVDVCNISVVA